VKKNVSKVKSLVKKKIKMLKKPEVYPVVGQYDTSCETIEGGVRRKEARLRRAEEIRRNKNITGNAFRFFTPNRDRQTVDKEFVRKGYHAKYLGPGCYNIVREFEPSSFKFQGSIFMPKGERFKEKKNNSPGPRHYQKNDINPWNKKTFNLLFNKEYQL